MIPFDKYNDQLRNIVRTFRKMITVEDKIEQWKKLLLDLGKRNHLVNYKNTKRSTLNIINPDIYTLWDELVQQEKTLTFANATRDEEFDDDADDEESSEELLNGPTVIKGDLSSDRSVLEQQAVLRNLKSKAKTFMEEQGINVLYLCFGFLLWNEKENSADFFDAPLILVPISIDQDNIWSPYTISLQGDEIIVNPTMSYKLENDFDISIPTFNADVDDLQQFFKSVKECVRYMHGWKVEEKIGLALLSFQNINMYRDVERRKADIIANPVVKALNGETGSLSEFDSAEIDAYNFDKQNPQDVFQVVDADSSQQTAILCAQKGISFVLQGPPGTGKSQTITNIIADRLANGKKVLFVSEKKAALDVVYSRLHKAGLSDFCLVLHSNKANKKQIMSQFRDILDLANKRVMIKNDIYQKLKHLQVDRDELDQYVQELHEVIQPIGKSIYEVNGILANLEPYPDVICSFEKIKSTTAELQISRISLLEQISNKLREMPGGYRNNPWRGCHLTFINHELRQSLSTQCKKIADGLSEYEVTINLVSKEFHVSGVSNCYGLQKLYRLLQVGSEAPEIKMPDYWFDSSKWPNIDQLIKEGTRIQKKYEQLSFDISKRRQELKEIITESGVVSKNVELTELYRDYLSQANSLMDGVLHFSLWKNNNLSSEYIQRLNDFIEDYTKLKQEISCQFDDGIYEIDTEPILIRYRTDYYSFFKRLGAQYRADRKQISAHSLKVGEKLSDDVIIKLLVALHHIYEIEDDVAGEEGGFRSALGDLYHGLNTDFVVVEREKKIFDQLQTYIASLKKMDSLLSEAQRYDKLFASNLGNIYQGILSDWDGIREAFAWTEQYCTALKKENLYVTGFITCAQNGGAFSELCKKYIERIENNLNRYQKPIDEFVSLFDDREFYLDADFAVFKGRVSDCNDLTALEEWIDFKNLQSEGNVEGLSDYLKTALESDIRPDYLVKVYEKCFYKQWLDQVEPDFPAVASFRTSIQNNRIRDFCELDKTQFEIAQKRIRGRLINSLPSTGTITKGDDEISILKREANKQRKIMPVRKLFNLIPELIQTLKPCMMMSPLSVSLFLESPKFVFDTVIFDEASQVKTENAIGAIIRGKQVIIAGDSHQLPPTNFFVSGAADEDDDDDYEMGAFESVLDEAALLPQETLLWHYRSRNEQLIAFSNSKIYRNKLITFPSSIAAGEDIGVEFVNVPDGFYDRGGRKGNVQEAKKVAELVYQHFEKYPNRSLGVITFGVVQQMAVEEQIRQLQQKASNYKYKDFFSENGNEPFFVKSLENVQGDERDTIIFSVGYGKDAYGKMYNSFGPLSRDGGERRLNVAITRAKYNVKLVSSIWATDINVDSGKEGPKLLRAYIDYAIHGPKTLGLEPVENDDVTFDSPFEMAVYDFLDSKGYKVGTQIGCSGFRIDLGVKHPTLNGRYVLGIECDGATYHSAKTARERDRLRQDILELMGWKIYRIWSTDWIKDPVSEAEKLVNAVENAISSYREDELLEPKSISKEQPESDDMIKEVNLSEEDKRKALYKFSSSPFVSYMDINKNVTPFTEDGVLDYIIDTLQPVLFDDICKYYAPFMGKERVSATVKEAVRGFFSRNGWKYSKDKEEFYCCSSKQPIKPREAGDRKINQISLNELEEGLLTVARAQRKIGLTEESLVRETLKAFGFQKLSKTAEQRMESAFNHLVQLHTLDVDPDGHVILKQT